MEEMMTGQTAGTEAGNPAAATPTALGGEPPKGGENTQSGAPAPAVPEAYDFSAVLEETGSTLDEKTAAEFSDILKGMGANQDQAAQMAKYGLTYVQGIAQQVAEQMSENYAKEVQHWGEEAKQELGANYDQTLGAAAAVRDYLEEKVPGFTAMLNLTGAGNHISLIKAMAAMAPLITEDPGYANGGTAAAQANMYPNTNWDSYK